MRCEAVQNLFSEIYDQVAEGQALLEEHLQSCEACMHEYRAYSQMLDELRSLPVPELPAGFHATAMDNIKAQVARLGYKQAEARKRIRSATRRWAGVAAAACLLLVSLWAVRIFDMPIGHSGEFIESEAYFTPQAGAAESMWDTADMADMEADYAFPAEMAADLPDEVAMPSLERNLDDFAVSESESEQESEQEYEAEEEWAVSAVPESYAPQEQLLEDGVYIGIQPMWDDMYYGADGMAAPWDEAYIYPIGDFYAFESFGGAPHGLARDALPGSGSTDNNTSQVWVIAVVASLALLCLALGMMFRSIHKNKK